MEKPRNSFRNATKKYNELVEDYRKTGNTVISEDDLDIVKYSPKIIYKLIRHILPKHLPLPGIIKEYLFLHKSPRYSYLSLLYRDNFSNEEVGKLEEVIATNPGYSFRYARVVLKGPFRKGELNILKSPKVRPLYLRYLQDTRELIK